LVLVEHFTQASCGPCASQNPALKTLLDANATKVVALKYQTSWPGVDPMNAANPTEAAARVQYYNVTGVPNSVMDGSGPGSPGTIVTTSTINNRYNTAAPLNLSASHQWTAGYDSIQIGVFVANAGTATVASGASGSLKLHVAVIEEEVNYPSAPGSNGETTFYQVMRKMVPDASGTTMADSWTAGQTQMFVFKVAAPSYLANLNKVAVVAFIQDNSNKSVLNAARTSATTIAGLPDIGVNAFTAATPGLCNGTTTPMVTIKNEGSLAITSASVAYAINGGTPVTQNWTGSLSAGATAVVTFPQVTLPAGSNSLVATVSAPNGTGDVNGMNNMSAPLIAAVLNNTPTPAPYSEDMESTSFNSIPAGHVLLYNTATKPLVTVVSKAQVNGLPQELGGYGQSAKSLMVDFFTMQSGAQASIITPKVSGITANHKLYFNHAYASYAGEADGLKVFVSSNCGSTWTNVYDKSGTALATAANASSRFFPQPTQWYPNTISLSQFAGQELIVKFECNSAYGNNLWLDNFWINTAALGEEEIQAAQAKLYPNPARDAVKVSLQVSEAGEALVEVINLNGQTVIARSTSVEAGMQSIDLQVGDLANGVYTVKIALNDRVETLRFTVQH
ncbi:MAG: Omp28-related outer membrane protein, partial [Cryomorphaceae bacterium]|nr:Omp28-related outer membrane protein [Cryomorphaceae bacterium]